MLAGPGAIAFAARNRIGAPALEEAMRKL